MIQLQRNGVRWEMTSDFQPLLEGVLSQPGQPIKETPAKLVSLVECQGQRFYLKHYRYDAVPLRPYKYLFKSSQARQEWELARAMTAKNIPIVRHVALGERWRRGGLREGILITEEFRGIPVREAGQEFADRVLALIHTMHEAGAIQHDLHGANVLVNPESGEVRLVDLHGIQLKRRLSDAEKQENLARLRKFQSVSVPAEIESLSRDMRRQMHHRRSFRAWKTNRDFAPQRHGDHQWQVRLDRMNDDVARILRDPESFLAGASEKFKNGRTSTVAAHGSWVLKRYNFKKPLNLLKDLLRPSRAHASLRKAYHLELAGIPTATPLAAANRRRFGLITGGYFLMAKIPGAVALRDYQGDPVSALRKVAVLIARLHEAGFSHRDLKTANIMFDRDDQPVLIDLDGLSFEDVLPPGRVVADLRRLETGARRHPLWQPSFAARFVKYYCRQRHLKPRQLRSGG